MPFQTSGPMINIDIVNACSTKLLQRDEGKTENILKVFMTGQFIYEVESFNPLHSTDVSNRMTPPYFHWLRFIIEFHCDLGHENTAVIWLKIRHGKQCRYLHLSVYKIKKFPSCFLSSQQSRIMMAPVLSGTILASLIITESWLV